METSPSPPMLPELREVVPESDILTQDLVQPENSLIQNHAKSVLSSYWQDSTRCVELLHNITGVGLSLVNTPIECKVLIKHRNNVLNHLPPMQKQNVP